MKTHKYHISAFLLTCFCLSASTSHADVFGTDDKKWEQLFSTLKKISIRLTDNVDVQLKSLQTSQADLVSQIDRIKSALPAIQGAIEQNSANVAQQLAKLDERLTALEKSQRETGTALRQGLAVDMDNLAKRTSESQAAVVAGLANMDTNNARRTSESQAAIVAGLANIDTNNKKMIEILAKALQESQDVGKNVGLLGKNLGAVNEHVDLTKDMLAKLKEIVVAKLETIAKEQGATDSSLKIMEEKISQSMLKVDPGMANLDLANQKLSKLIEILKAFAVEQEKIVKNQLEMSNALSEMRSKAGSSHTNGEVKKSSKKSTSEGKHKKSDD